MFIKYCYGLDESTPARNSYVEILILKVMIVGDGDTGQWLGHEGGALLNWISAIIKEEPEKLVAFLLYDFRKKKWLSMKEQTLPES